MALFVLMAAGVPATGAAQEAPRPATPDWTLEDGAGDISPADSALPAVVPENPAMAHIDIVGATISNEDEMGLLFSILVSELRVVPDAFSPGFSYAEYQVDFELEGSTAGYSIEANVYGSSLSPDPTSFFAARFAYGWLCLEIDGDGCYSQPVNVYLDDAENAIRIWIPKASLLGSGDYGGGSFGGGMSRSFSSSSSVRPQNITAGSRLVDFHVESRYDSRNGVCIFLCPPAPEFYDSAPDDGTSDPYVLKSGAANSVIALHLQDFAPKLSVEAGANTTHVLMISNGAAAKRLVKLTYALEGDPGQVANYAVWGPPAVQVPGGEVRNFTVAIDSRPDAAITDDVRLVIRGVSVGREDEVALIAKGLAAGLALGPSNNVLYIQARDSSRFGPPADAAFCETAFISCTDGFLSTVKEVAGTSASGQLETWGRPTGPDSFEEEIFAGLEQTLPAPVAFQPDGQIEMSLHLVPPHDTPDVQVSATLYYAYAAGDDHFFDMLFEESATTDLSAAGTTVTLTGPARLGGNPIWPTGTYVDLRITLSTSGGTGAPAFALGGTKITTGESTIRFPLTELPEELRKPKVPSPFQLSVLGERDMFVNPGEARLYNVTVLNQDMARHRAVLEAKTDVGGWLIEVLPGASYDLEPGDAIKVGVLVHAPADAKEGDVSIVRLNATDEAGSLTFLTLATTATTGYDFDDDKLNFKADEDAEARLFRPGAKDTPGLSLVAGLASVGAAWVWTRRRRA